MCKPPQGYTLSVISKYNIIIPHTRSEVGDLGETCTTGRGKRVNQGQVSAEKKWRGGGGVAKYQRLLLSRMTTVVKTHSLQRV